jgi:hypothetical protein
MVVLGTSREEEEKNRFESAEKNLMLHVIYFRIQKNTLQSI